MAEPTASVLVVVPTYNERDNLEPLLSRLHAAVPAAHVLVVDDSSPDGTGELADKLRAQAAKQTRVLQDWLAGPPLNLGATQFDALLDQVTQRLQNSVTTKFVPLCVAAAFLYQTPLPAWANASIAHITPSFVIFDVFSGEVHSV